jgi:hypothetical protein
LRRGQLAQGEVDEELPDDPGAPPLFEPMLGQFALLLLLLDGVDADDDPSVAGADEDDDELEPLVCADATCMPPNASSPASEPAASNFFSALPCMGSRSLVGG